jgi:transcriptional regulator with XRE-family HTH domain
MTKDRSDFKYMVDQVKQSLEAILVERNMSRRELAQKLRISEDYLGKMMRGDRDWKVEYLKKAADVLDKPLDSLLSDTFGLPVIARIGGETEQVPLDYRQVSFNYRDAVAPRKVKMAIGYVPYPELPKSLAAKTYVLEVAGPMGIPELLPGMHLYITRGLGNAQALKDGDLVVYANEEPDEQGEHRGFVCRIRWDKENDPDYIYFTTSNISPSVLGFEIKKLAALVSGIDVVVAIVLRPDLLVLK